MGRPHWIDSVPGAEAWALCEALRHSVPGAELWSDCLSVVNRFKAGREAATSSAVKLARLWGTIFDLCDSFEDPARQVRLEWMPAHTSAAQIGRARKGNGEQLTEQARSGNDAADKLAKKGARSHGVPGWKQAQLKTAERVALRAAMRLGVTTWAANNHQQEVTKPDGTTDTITLRDCEGIAKAKRQKSSRTERKKTARVEAGADKPATAADHPGQDSTPTSVEQKRQSARRTKTRKKGKVKAGRRR